VIISLITTSTHVAVLVSSFAVFFFLVLFCLFPVGLGPVDPESGAPLSPMLGRKALIALGIASVLWVVFYALIHTGVVDL
jgi:predicted secreted protein